MTPGPHSLFRSQDRMRGRAITTLRWLCDGHVNTHSRTSWTWSWNDPKCFQYNSQSRWKISADFSVNWNRRSIPFSPLFKIERTFSSTHVIEHVVSAHRVLYPRVQLSWQIGRLQLSTQTGLTMIDLSWSDAGNSCAANKRVFLRKGLAGVVA